MGLEQDIRSIVKDFDEALAAYCAARPDTAFIQAARESAAKNPDLLRSLQGGDAAREQV